MDKVSAFGKNFTYVTILMPGRQECTLQLSRIPNVGSLTCDSVLISLLRASFSPFAARTQQYVKEQLGQADDKVRQHTVLLAKILTCELPSLDSASP